MRLKIGRAHTTGIVMVGMAWAGKAEPRHTWPPR
jgi:hypothetical protein